MPIWFMESNKKINTKHILTFILIIDFHHILTLFSYSDGSGLHIARRYSMLSLALFSLRPNLFRSLDTVSSDVFFGLFKYSHLYSLCLEN